MIDGLSKEERVKRFLEDPLGVFTEQILLGRATPDLGAICLMKHAKLQQAVGPGTIKPGERESESAAAVVLEGLRKQFGPPAETLKNERLLNAVTYALIIEGREHVIVRWARATTKEAMLSVRQSILKQGVYHMRMVHGWIRAVNLFRQVLGGMREAQGRFSLGEHCSTALQLCEAGVEGGFQGTPEFMKLVRSSTHWAIGWQQQAMVQLKYGKMTGVGVKYFYELSQRDEDFWKSRGSFWYMQNSRLAMELAQECLEQKQVKEAEMIAELIKRRFYEKFPGLEEESVNVKIDAGKTREKITRDSGNEEHSSDLQGILNALG